MSSGDIGIAALVVCQAVTTGGLFYRVRDFAKNVLFSTFITTGLMAAFLFSTSSDPFNLIAVAMVFGASLLVGSPLFWFIFKSLHKILFRRGSHEV